MATAIAIANAIAIAVQRLTETGYRPGIKYGLSQSTSSQPRHPAASKEQSKLYEKNQHHRRRQAEQCSKRQKYGVETE
ncbi:hypothetical protein KEM54_000070 [Ascosphaera aggregata]|nr:hypothetical protein KEM54_000070 [Ascosphaera aggregata]